MRTEKFWQTIDRARQNAKRGQSLELPLTAELKQMLPKEVVAFHNIYRLYMDAADVPLVRTAVQLRNGGGLLTGDAYEYARSGLVAAGRDAFSKCQMGQSELTLKKPRCVTRTAL